MRIRQEMVEEVTESAFSTNMSANEFISLLDAKKKLRSGDIVTVIYSDDMITSSSRVLAVIKGEILINRGI